VFGKLTVAVAGGLGDTILLASAKQRHAFAFLFLCDLSPLRQRATVATGARSHPNSVCFRAASSIVDASGYGSPLARKRATSSCTALRGTPALRAAWR